MLSFAASVAATLVSVFAPIVRTTETQFPRAGVAITRTYSTSLYSETGAGLLIIAAIPVLLALGGLLVPHRNAKIVSTILLWASCILGGFSVGLYFVPAAVLMSVAARRDRVLAGAVRPTTGVLSRH